MWNGVVKVTVLPLMLAISMTWATGLSVRENQLREGSPGGEVSLHCVMEVSVSLSMRTSSPPPGRRHSRP